MGGVDPHDTPPWDVVEQYGPAHRDRRGLFRVENMPLFDGLYVYGEVVTKTICLGYGDESLLDPKHSVKVYGDRSCTHTGLRGATLMGLVTRYAHVCRKCPCNLHNALCNRHLKLQPVFCGDFQPAYEYFEDDMASLKYHYNSILPMVRKNWLNKWSNSKRELILKSIKNDPYLFDVLAPFVKREISVNLGDVAPVKARAIQGYKNMLTQYVTARAITAAQKAFARVYGIGNRRDIDVCFASGLSSRQLGDWMAKTKKRYPNAVFFERDGKNWDATMARQHFDLKMHVLRGMIDEVQTLAAIEGGFSCRAAARFGAFGTTRISYKVVGTVKSGHNDTSLGNSIVNAGIAISAMRACSLVGRVLVMGDDLLVAMPGDFDADRLASVEASLGIKPEYRKFSNEFDVSFISQVWYPTGRVDHPYFTGPRPGKILSKLFWTVKPPGKKYRHIWIHSVCKGLANVCQHIPIVRAWLEVHDRFAATDATEFRGKDHKWFRFMDDWYSETVEVDYGAVLDVFCKRYDLNPVCVAQCEARILAVKQPHGVVVDEILDRICQCDLVDLADRPLCR